MISTKQHVNEFLDALLFLFASAIVALPTSTSAVLGAKWVLNMRIDHELTLVVCLCLYIVFFSAIFVGGGLTTVSFSQTRSRFRQFLAGLGVSFGILISFGAAMSLAVILNPSLISRLLLASDGPGHLAILLGLEENQVSGIYPYLVLSDGSRVGSQSPYPVGSHYLAVVVAMTLGIDSFTAYGVMVSTFEYLIFPLAIVCLFRSASGSALSVQWYFLAFLTGILYRPFAEFFQGPTVIGVSLAIVAASIAPRIEIPILRVLFLPFVSVAILLIHPSAFVLFILIVAKLYHKPLYKVYTLLLVVVGLFYFLTVENLRTYGYFTTWISSNESNLTPSQLFARSALVKGGQFGVTFVLGVGRNDFFPIAITLTLVLLMVTNLKRSDLIDCGFVLLLLLSTALTGFKGIGVILGALTFPWYGTPHRFVIVWSVVLVMTFAQSRQFLTSDHHA